MPDDESPPVAEAALAAPAPRDDAPTEAQEADPHQLAWDAKTEIERSDILVEAKVPALGLSRLLWAQVPVDVQLAVEPYL